MLFKNCYRPNHQSVISYLKYSTIVINRQELKSKIFRFLKDTVIARVVDEVAEWLRRWTANPLGSARVGSNPIFVVSFFELEPPFMYLAISCLYCLEQIQCLNSNTRALKGQQGYRYFLHIKPTDSQKNMWAWQLLYYAVTRIRTWVVAATTRSTNHYTITASTLTDSNVDFFYDTLVYENLYIT